MNAPDETTSTLSRVLAVLTAVAGLGGLVAATGAAIVWVRFEQAKLPGEHAVAVTPEPALVAIGGAALGAFALVAALAVLIVYLVDSHGTHKGQATTVLLLAGTGVAIAVLFTEASTQSRLVAVGVTAVATLAAVGLVAIALDAPGVNWVRAHRWVLLGAGVTAVVAAVLVLAFVVHEVLAAVALAVVSAVLTVLLVLAFLSVDEKRPGALNWLIDRAGGLIRLLAAPAALVVLALVLYLILNEWWILAMVPVAAALVLGVLRVAFRTERRFTWYGTAVFVAVVVFGAALHAVRAVNVPRLQPMAILFTDAAGGGGQSGLFVSDGSSDRVYLGLVERCHRNPRDLVLRPGAPKGGTGQIVSVPRSQIAAESVGTMARLNVALVRAPKLLDALGKRFTPVGGEPPPLPVHPCSEEGVIDQKVRDTSPVDPGTAERLATRFRPVLRFDSRERWRPLNIDRLLVETGTKGPAHRLCDGVEESPQHCSPIVLPSQIAAAPNDPKAFVDLAGVKLGGEEHRSPALDACPSQPQQERPLLDCDSGPASAIYYRVVGANDRFYVDYWWFLRYNRFAKHGATALCRSVLTRNDVCSDHEGDWEGVTVVVSRATPGRLDFVNYAAHAGVFRYTREQIERVGRRPVVYVARGSHAGYPVSCASDCEQDAKLLGRALPEDNTDGLAEWGRNGEAECRTEPRCLLPLPTGSWGAFAGVWGSRTCTGGDGSCRLGGAPRSPASQRRFSSPWCYNGVGLRLACDGRLPGSS